MPLDGPAGHSGETRQKQEDLGEVLDVFLTLIQGPKFLGNDWAYPEYLYWDFNAGPGLTDSIRGSPLVFLETVIEKRVPFHAYLFEKDLGACAALRTALLQDVMEAIEALALDADEVGEWHKTARCCLCDACTGYYWTLYDEAERDGSPIGAECEHCLISVAADWLDEHVTIVPGDHNETAPPIIERVRRQVGARRWVFGLAYGDGNGLTDTPIVPLAEMSKQFPRLDILLNVNATIYKRLRRKIDGRPTLLQTVALIEKDCRLIREVRGAWNWTMLFMTNWASPPDLRRVGFEFLSSPSGQAIAEQAEFTRDERQARRQSVLPFEPSQRIAPMPSISAIPDSGLYERSSSRAVGVPANAAMSDEPRRSIT